MIRVLAALLTASVALGACAPLSAQENDGEGATETRQRYTIGSRQWEILFDDGIAEDEYARQLDFFKIEIGAVSKQGRIEYISDVTGRKPQRRLGSKDREYRAGVGWRRGDLHAADRRLLRKAGINSQDKELMHYLPPQLQRDMEQLEADYGHLQQSEIHRTRFKIQEADDGPGYRFVVVEQDPPRAESESASRNEPDRP